MTESSEIETDDEDARLALRAQSGDAGARDDLVHRHTKIVKATAKAFARRHGRDLDDEVAEGFLGLIEAVADFDPSRGVPFEAFARARILFDAKDRLRKEVRRQKLSPTSSDADATEPGGKSPIAEATDRVNEAAAREEWDEFRHGKDRGTRVARCLSRLDDVDYVFIGERVGLFNGKEKTWEEMGQEWGLTPEAAKKRFQRRCRKLASEADSET
jgi:RNA polymerase sigma factor (sigma-70 family)